MKHINDLTEKEIVAQGISAIGTAWVFDNTKKHKFTKGDEGLAIYEMEGFLNLVIYEDDKGGSLFLTPEDAKEIAEKLHHYATQCVKEKK